MSDRQSRAEQFYQELTGNSDPVAFLHGLVSQGKAEDEFLEFKGVSRIAERDAKQYWSQALSGFANTEGGVLIWGIRAARITSPTDPSRTVDAASGLDLAAHPETFLQMLKDVRLEATIDPVQGVKCEHYDAGQGGGAGFVVCLIPEGVHKPYLAALQPVKQYYQRVGDSFVVIPHAMLRSLFYPRGSPVLAVDVTAERQGGTAKLRFSITNVGNMTARELYVVENDSTLSWSYAWAKGGTGHGYGPPLHPGQSIFFGTVQPKHQGQTSGDIYDWNPVAVRLTAYLGDHPPQVISIQYGDEDIRFCRPRRFTSTIEEV